MLGELSPGLAVIRVLLAPLSPEAVADLAEPYGVDPDGLHRVTGGNPFFVTEVLASGEHEIPATVRDAVLARAARLTLAARASSKPWRSRRRTRSCGSSRRSRARSTPGSTSASRRACSSPRTGPWRSGTSWRAWALEESVTTARRLSLHRGALEALALRSDSAISTWHGSRTTPMRPETGMRCSRSLRQRARTPRRSARIGRRPSSTRALFAIPKSLPPSEVAELLKRRSRECYLTDQADEAIDALRRAVECYRELGDRFKEGETLAKLASILWCPGRGEEARLTARQAVDLLEQLPPGRELALAHASLSFVLCGPGRRGRMAGGMSGARTGGAARRPGRLCKVLFAVGMAGAGEDPDRGLATIERAAALAEERGLESSSRTRISHEPSCDVGAPARRRAQIAFEEGLAYCRSRATT